MFSRYHFHNILYTVMYCVKLVLLAEDSDPFGEYFRPDEGSRAIIRVLIGLFWGLIVINELKFTHNILNSSFLTRI